MKKSAVLFAFLFAVLAVPFAFSENVGISVGKEQSEASISPLGEAAFAVTITNTDPGQDLFVLELSDVAWSLRTTKASDVTTGFALGGYESKKITIYIKPIEKISEGTYFVELRIRSTETGKTASALFAIKIDPKIIDYAVKIPIEVLEPVPIDPEKATSIKILLKNPHPVYLINISVEVTSKFLNRKTVVDIPPESEKILDFTLNIDKSTPKQEDKLEVVVKQNENLMASAQKTLYINDYRLPYEKSEEARKGFLYTKHIITFTNTEKIRKTQDVMIPALKTYALLLTKPEAETKEFNGKLYLVWTGLSLAPDEKFTVTVTEDYRIFAVVGIFIVALIIIYWLHRSPIVVKKKAYAIRKKDTGNNEIKVVLHVKNRSSRELNKVRVFDRLPGIHRIDEDFGPGTPEPKYRRSRQGMVLDWDISLAAKEERVFSYKLQSDLPIVGEFTLKPCIVQYGLNNRRTSSAPYRLVID